MREGEGFGERYQHRGEGEGSECFAGAILEKAYVFGGFLKPPKTSTKKLSLAIQRVVFYRERAICGTLQGRGHAIEPHFQDRIDVLDGQRGVFVHFFVE